MPSTDPITKESVIGQRSAHLQKPWEQHPPLFYRYRDDEKNKYISYKYKFRCNVRHHRKKTYTLCVIGWQPTKCHKQPNHFDNKTAPV